MSSPDYSRSVVPDTERKSTLGIALVLAGFCICMSGLFTGSAMASGLSFSQALLATFLGNLILAIYGGFMGALGAKTGKSTALLVKDSFGLKGGPLISSVLAVTLLGWYAVQTGFFGQTIMAMELGSHWIVDIKIAALWGGLLMMITPYLGYKGLQWLSNITVPLVVILSLWGVWEALKTVDVLAYVPTDPISLGQGITLTVGSFAVGAVLQPDVTRYAKSARAAWVATLAGYLLGNTYIIATGSVMTMATSHADLPSAMMALGLGLPALLILIFAQWTTNDNNLYSSSLAFTGLFPGLSKRQIVLISGSVATLAGVLGLAEAFIPWLIHLGTFIPPIAGVIIADAFSRKLGTPTPFRYAAFAAWGLGALGGYFLPGIAALNGLMIAFLGQCIFAKIRVI